MLLYSSVIALFRVTQLGCHMLLCGSWLSPGLDFIGQYIGFSSATLWKYAVCHVWRWVMGGESWLMSDVSTKYWHRDSTFNELY